MFKTLKEINTRPLPFEFYTAADLWTDDYTAKQMLAYHLNEYVDLSSRNRTFVDESAQWIVKKFDLEPGKAIADFGCGPGLYCTHFAEAGADVVGIDFNLVAIDYAKEDAKTKGLDITYHCADYLTFDTDQKFDLITLIFCDLCTLNPDQRATMLDKFKSMLKPGGAIFFDVFTVNEYDRKAETMTIEKNALFGFWSDEDYFGILKTFKYDDLKVVLDKHTIIQKDSVKTVYNWLQHYTLSLLKNETATCGLKIVEVFSDVAGTTYSEDENTMAVVVKP
jgi:2-polyprenyl-3-methyl-5-hydroxy-6-metoxy-1,4-benzoquinol methylase